MKEQQTQVPFQFYIQTIGRGRKRRRSLTFKEAKHAMTAILNGEVSELQLGAFLMLIRVREETPEEAAGFVAAIREALGLAQFQQEHASNNALKVDLDWGSYAGKRREPPWFVLALKALAQQGVKICLHGVQGQEENRLYTQSVAEALGIEVAKDLKSAQQQIASAGICYLPLEHYAPQMKALMDKREELGLRSPVHTVARMLNPLSATVSVHGVFHKGYDQLHQATAQILCEQGVMPQNGAVWAFCGDSGEAEPRADRKTPVFVQKCQNPQSCPQTLACQEEKILPKRCESGERRHVLSIERLQQVWSGTLEDAYGEQTVLQTLTLAKQALSPEMSFQEASQWSKACWQKRAG